MFFSSVFPGTKKCAWQQNKYLFLCYIYGMVLHDTFFKRFYLLFREREKEGEKEGEEHQYVRDTLIGCLSPAPNWGPGAEPRHVP